MSDKTEQETEQKNTLWNECMQVTHEIALKAPSHKMKHSEQE